MYLKRAQKWTYIVLALTLAVMLLAAGCAKEPAPTTAPTTAPTATPTTPAGEEPQYGGILRYWVNGEPGGWDAQRQARYASSYTLPIFNNLVQFDPAQQFASPGTIVGDLADSWEVSADGLTVTW